MEDLKNNEQTWPRWHTSTVPNNCRQTDVLFGVSGKLIKPELKSLGEKSEVEIRNHQFQTIQWFFTEDEVQERGKVTSPEDADFLTVWGLMGMAAHVGIVWTKVKGCRPLLSLKKAVQTQLHPSPNGVHSNSLPVKNSTCLPTLLYDPLRSNSGTWSVKKCSP